MMDTAKIFENGRSQAIRLPKKFRFTGEEVFIQRLGDVVMLIPKETAWDTFLTSLDGFTEDFMAEGRDQVLHDEREEL